ncbi:MAG: hypothetical protein H7257_15060 [Taibaiella sp.]|nr:hypothetical protein [Taibaiella sp.]
MYRETVALVVFAFIFITGCVKDKPTLRNNTTPLGAKGVYVLCEGALGRGDGSLFLYQPENSNVYGDIYAAANGTSPGDVVQSITRIGTHFFLAVNNSKKILVTDTGNYKLAGVINIPFPRYIVAVSSDRAYVSTLFSNKLYIINTAAYTLTDSIELPAKNPEGMAVHDGYVYVCCWDTASTAIYKINITDNKIAQTITCAGHAPHDILLDKEQKLWVLSGNKTQGKSSAWTRIEPSTGGILKSVLFPAEADPIKPVLNEGGDTIYYIQPDYLGGTANNGIYRMSINSNGVPSVPFVAARAYQYFWAIGLDPKNHNIYIADPLGFNQSGIVSIYNNEATLLSTFKVGIGPGQFYFGN